VSDAEGGATTTHHHFYLSVKVRCESQGNLAIIDTVGK